MSLTSFIETKTFHIEDYNGLTRLNAIFVGNDLQSNLFTNFDFPHYIENFFHTHTSFVSSEPECMVIWGALNLNQLGRVKYLLEENEQSLKKVIYVKSSVDDYLSEHCYNLVNNLEDHIKVDLVYEKFPINLADFFEAIKAERLGQYEN